MRGRRARPAGARTTWRRPRASPTRRAGRVAHLPREPRALRHVASELALVVTRPSHDPGAAPPAVARRLPRAGSRRVMAARPGADWTRSDSVTMHAPISAALHARQARLPARPAALRLALTVLLELARQAATATLAIGRLRAPPRRPPDRELGLTGRVPAVAPAPATPRDLAPTALAQAAPAPLPRSATALAPAPTLLMAHGSANSREARVRGVATAPGPPRARLGTLPRRARGGPGPHAPGRTIDAPGAGPTGPARRHDPQRAHAARTEWRSGPHGVGQRAHPPTAAHRNHRH